MGIEQQLAGNAERLKKAKEELLVIEEQVAFLGEVAGDARIRMLVAETPLARREYQEALGDHERMQRTRDRALARIEELTRDQDRLLERLLEEGA